MTRSRPGFLTALALGVTVVLWASAFPAIKAALSGYDAGSLSFLRLAVASAALAVAAPFLGVRRPRARDLPLVAVCGAAGMTAYQLLLNWGELAVPAGTASLLVSVAPLFSVLLAAAFLGERLTPRVVAGSLVALGGCAVIALSGGDAGYTVAAWAVLGAAAVQGLYHVAMKPLLRRHTALEVTCWAMWSGTLFLLPLAAPALRAVPAAPAGATVAVVLLGLLPSALGFVAWGFAVQRVPVQVATSALYLVPVVALAVSFAWLGEVPTPVELAGGAVSVAGVALLRSRSGASGRQWTSWRFTSGRRAGATTTGTASSTRPGRRPPIASATTSGASRPSSSTAASTAGLGPPPSPAGGVACRPASVSR
jgi:drug/metabolite transporter (DMT)-like permease